ncbi:MAG: transposase [Calditrichota bacterium]
MFDENYANDDPSAPAYPPKILLKIVVFASTRGLVSSRQIEHHRTWSQNHQELLVVP